MEEPKKVQEKAAEVEYVPTEEELRQWEEEAKVCSDWDFSMQKAQEGLEHGGVTHDILP